MRRGQYLRSGTWWRLRRRRLLQVWAVGFAASVVVTTLSAGGYLESTQARGLDLLLRLRGASLRSDVVIVAIDDRDFEALGQRQPISRDYLARIVRGLRRAGAVVVGLDIAFGVAEPGPGDAELVRAITGFSDGALSRVVLTPLPTGLGGPLGAPALREATLVGRPDVPEDGDGVIRAAAYSLRTPAGVEPAFSLAVVARVAGVSQERLRGVLLDPGARLALPAWRPHGGRGEAPAVDVAPGTTWRINFAGPAGTFLTIPSRVIAALADGGEISDANPFRDRVVLVGATFADSRDTYQTAHGRLPGVEVHANLVHMLLARSFITPSGWLLSLLVQGAVVMVGGLLLIVFRSTMASIAVILVALALSVVMSYALFHGGGYWVDFMLPVLATRAVRFGSDRFEGRHLRATLGRYLSPEIAREVLADTIALHGDRRTVSILFSDLRGFTALAETMPPEAVAARLNEYFEAMTQAIFRCRGMINDFVGDAIMAVFGAPVADPAHAQHAVGAAVAMDAALAALNGRWVAAGLPTLRMGIGIHSGEVFAGNVGSDARMKYSIVGDAVNLASRVEGLNKALDTTILITEATRALLGDRAEVRDYGTVAVAGRSGQVQVHELVGLREGDAIDPTVRRSGGPPCAAS
ncbi:MAG: adenylate/guanylate cyclase domain-containing protein [Candidatus Rokubacteria bacterium]|nr:adenylate/guanylate cyclase domain-containing protein [Candidatus Rokubacteria bacterium]